MSTHERPRRRASWRAAALLAALIVLPAALLSACGSDDDSDSSAGEATASASGGDSPEWCGDEPVTLGIQDGGGLNDWSKQSLEQVKIAAGECPAIEKQIVVNAGFDPQKAVSGFQGMVAQGANAIVIIPDAGVCAELPSMRQATQRGVVVVPWAADPCGEAGSDFEEYVDFDNIGAGRHFAEFVGEQMDGKGNLLYLGGPAGNPVDAGEIKGMYEVLDEKYPDITVLDDVTEENWPATNWDPAEASKVTSALLAKYPQIDGIISSYGSVASAAIKEFEKEGRPIPPIATLEQNELACIYEDKKGTPDEFALATVSNRNWLGQVAVRKAVAAVNGIDDPGKDIVDLPFVENSTDPDLQPVCDPNAPAEAFHSNEGAKPEQQINELVYGES
jgi:ribose transport system substrate-binding protein